MSETIKTAVIGAGASGLTAAICAARRGEQTVVFEHKDRAGIKLSITGNGKCNFTNAYMSPECFYSEKGSAVDAFLNRFGTEDALEFFDSLGIGYYCRNGYYYPESSKASDVVFKFVSECEKLNVQIKYNCEPDIQALISEFDKVILACGSRAHKETGSNGTGYKYLERLGIKYSRVLPALCAVYCDDQDYFAEHKGERVIGTVEYDSHMATGEIQITDYGLSGIPVFQLSRYISKDQDNACLKKISVDFHPLPEDIPEFLRDRFDKNNSRKAMLFSVTKTAGFNKSQVCTGGVQLGSLTENFELKEQPGVYVIGEMCDVDGICGGYNLHWAWLSGNLCGK